MIDTIAIIRDQATRLAEVARVEPMVPIPQYAGWSMTDLVAHTGSVHRRTIEIVTSLPEENPGRHPAPSLEPDELIDWFEEGAIAMAELLDEADPDTPVWGFGPSPTIGFWKTRMALETSVHRLDAEEATGEADDLDADLAAAGIDEFGIIWLGGLPVPDGPSGPLTGPFVGLHASDLGHRWVVEAGERFTLRRGEAPVRVTLHDVASDLYLFLIGRLPHHRLTADGDPEALEQWVTALDAQRQASV